MPIYEYQCLSCERVSEFFLRVSDPHPDTCPKCGRQTELKKQISQTSFSLRGEGWYVTDYKQGKKAGGEPGTSEVQNSTEGAASDGSKSEDATAKSSVEKPAAVPESSGVAAAKTSSSSIGSPTQTVGETKGK